MLRKINLISLFAKVFGNLYYDHLGNLLYYLRLKVKELISKLAFKDEALKKKLKYFQEFPVRKRKLFKLKAFGMTR